MTTPVTARPLDPTEVVVEGDTEVRPCGVCHQRLVVPTADLGKMAACPQCGAVGRALASGGPFAALTATPPPRPLPPADEPPLAPVVPYRRADPFDDRSPMVDAVAAMQWVSAAFLCLVAVFRLATHLKRGFAAEDEGVTVAASVALRLLVAVVLAVAGGGLKARQPAARAAAVGTSAVVIGWVGWLLRERLYARAGQAGWFDFTILAELPSLLVAVITVVLLLTPRYGSEFRRQAGTR